MERTTALDVFKRLEEARGEPDGSYSPPVYDVRLDAFTAQDAERDFRVRVTAGGQYGGVSADDWRFVFEVAEEAGVAFADLQNAGVELR